jgi:hypothetical protein
MGGCEVSNNEETITRENFEMLFRRAVSRLTPRGEKWLKTPVPLDQLKPRVPQVIERRDGQ